MSTKATDLGIELPPLPWDGSHIVVPISTEQLATFLARNAEAFADDDLFSLSPLSSPESTPPPTRPPTPRSESTPSQPRPPTPQPTPGNPAAAPASAGNASQRRKRKLQDMAHRWRKVQRIDQQDAQFGDASVPSSARDKYVAAAEPIFTAMPSKLADVTSTGFTAFDCNANDMKERYTLEELINRWGLKLQEWGGRSPMAIVDLDGRIVGILAGVPDTDDWEKQHREAAELLEGARRDCRLPQKSAHHRRGEFTTLRCGFTHGGGTTEPTNCANIKTNKRILDGLVDSEPFRRIAGFGSQVLKTWAPELHKHYVENLGKVQQDNPDLQRPFRNSVFPTTTFNLGPRTVCRPHRDFANLPFGLCVITALGSFDFKKGGHLVLWELGLVVEFPPGSTILIPSAIITHFNTPIQRTETRYSCTQYAAGGLFRWVEHGCELTEKHRSSLKPKELAELDRKNEMRWISGLSLLPRLPSVSSS